MICSKSFTTEETLSNAARAREWLEAAGIYDEALGRHFIAVTTQVAQAGEWHIPEERCFPLWDWVGGRYSLWSAVGFSIALGLGWSTFERLLTGARLLDTHRVQRTGRKPAHDDGAAGTVADPLPQH